MVVCEVTSAAGAEESCVVSDDVVPTCDHVGDVPPPHCGITASAVGEEDRRVLRVAVRLCAGQ